MSKTLYRSLALFILASPVFAAPVQEPNYEYTIVAPKCLISSVSHYQQLASKNNMYLIKVDESGLNELIDAKVHTKKPCGGFVNVTHKWKPSLSSAAFLNNYLPKSAPAALNESYDVKYSKEVNQLLSQINPQNMWTNLTTYSSYKDRYAGSDTGVQAANWLKTQVENMAKANNRTDVQVYTIATGRYKQPSVVAKFGDSTEPGIVIGAHMDTLQSMFDKKPGADDDGSGTVTVLEAARTIISSGMHFKKPIYFIWYAAEEEGLVGSQYVVEQFKKQKIGVSEVLHFDMTGYAPRNEDTLWLYTDYTNSELTKYLATLINAYVKKPIKYSTCGYACSDHATWTQNGYKSALPFESEMDEYNPSIHTSRDTIDKLSLAHMTDYLKIAVAFGVELANPV